MWIVRLTGGFPVLGSEDAGGKPSSVVVDFLVAPSSASKGSWEALHVAASQLIACLIPLPGPLKHSDSKCMEHARG